MSYLVDSDVVTDWLEGRTYAVQLLASLEGEGLYISLITYGEVYEGIYYSRDPYASERIFLRSLREIEVLSLSKRIMKRFARIRGQLRAQGNLITDPDLLIAVTAIHHELTLVTRNTRHFQRVPGLLLYQQL
jgi:tRNA(fMet)-specific endonuclease VapC